MKNVVHESPNVPKWSSWRPFPDPRRLGMLVAPFGPGCYELCDGSRLVLYGKGKNAALRMTSLLPEGIGSGTRKNKKKRAYVLEHLDTVEYRTLACWSHEQAVEEERKLRNHKQDYLFPT